MKNKIDKINKVLIDWDRDNIDSETACVLIDSILNGSCTNQ